MLVRIPDYDASRGAAFPGGHARFRAGISGMPTPEYAFFFLEVLVKPPIYDLIICA
jgi:hypothetical protein